MLTFAETAAAAFVGSGTVGTLVAGWFGMRQQQLSNRFTSEQQEFSNRFAEQQKRAAQQFESQQQALSDQFDAQQQIRTFLLPTTEQFAAASLVAFARLRAVRPPRAAQDGKRQHRNEILLFDEKERERRLQACSEAIDAVRQAHGGVRLMFRPGGDVPKAAWKVLRAQRRMLEVAAAFYEDCRADQESEVYARRAKNEPVASSAWKALRDQVGWRAFNQFVAAVALHLQNPQWETPGSLKKPSDADKIYGRFESGELQLSDLPKGNGSAAGFS